MSLEAMKEAILKLLADRPATSFVELCRDVPGFAGDEVLVSRFENLVLWTGVSLDGKRALAQLDQEGKLEYQPTPLLTYMIDGAGLKLPIAKRARNYKSFYWLPVTLHQAGK